MATPAPDITLSSLGNIRTKVRRLTLSPSASQLSNSDIDDYVNNFVLYDFPEHLRLFNMRKTFTFYTQPNVGTYDTNTTVSTDPLYNFNNVYISVHQPIYVAGYLVTYTQDRSQFYNVYPNINTIASIGQTGDGITRTFTGQVNSQQSIIPAGLNQVQIALLQNNVLFDSIDVDNNGLSLIDVPYNNQLGYLVIPNQPVSSADLLVPPNLTNNFINYLTGQFSISFPTPPATGVAINSQTVVYQPSRPLMMLFYDNKISLRPIPDQPYRVDMEVYQRPSYLLNSTDTPEISQWWQYIAFGAAKKVFEDRMDMDSVQLIMPEYKKQEALVLRKTIVQNTNDRVATIYTDQTNYGPDGQGFGGWGTGGF